MAWPSVKKSVETFCRRALAAVVCSKQTPSHIGFIMDGNRRYAQQFGMETALGHSMGYSVLLDCLQWCLELDIAVVSVYAFSIDNYNRSENEVDTLMVLAERKLLELSCEAEKLAERGVRVNVLGDLTLAPERVQVAAAHVADATKHNSKCTLNICFSYTSSQEIVQASRMASQYQRIDPSYDVHLDDFLYTKDCPPVDLLIRTSGETRLSDFMLRQSHCSLLHFSNKLWPEFSYFDLLVAILRYQRLADSLEEARVVVEEAKSRARIYQTLPKNWSPSLTHLDACGQEHRRKEISSPNCVVTPEDASSIDSPREDVLAVDHVKFL